jgi:hypothetical protein
MHAVGFGEIFGSRLTAEKSTVTHDATIYRYRQKLRLVTVH